MLFQRRQKLPDAALLRDEDHVVDVCGEIPHRPTRPPHHTGMLRMLVQRRQKPPDAACLYDEDLVVVVDSKIPHRPTCLFHHSGMVGMLPDAAISVNREFATGSARNGPRDIYRHNPWR